MQVDETRRTAERIARSSYGRLVAYISAGSGDLAAAEDALADAFASALANWPRSGVPDNPDAWLLTAARRRLIDEARKRQTHAAHSGHLELMAEELEQAMSDSDEIPDRRLALMFACAHPAMDETMRTPLILQTVLGLNAQQIAQAFLVSPTAMGQRLSRAKAKIRDARIPFVIPQGRELPERARAVLNAIYAVYTRGWAAGSEAGPTGLAAEAIWLAQITVHLLPDEPEAKGMLALMLYAEARRGARLDPDGNYVPFADQDTGLWDEKMLAAGEHMLREANRSGPSGRFQIEAAIQSAQVARRMTGADTWLAILALYDNLALLTGSPVVRLNRAAALAESGDPQQAAVELAQLAADPRMASYQPYWAARGHISASTGDKNDAHHAFTLAIGLSTDPAEQRYLQQRRDRLQDG